jgi:hypothetical protein
MTIAEFRDLIAATPIRPEQFWAVDRLQALLGAFDGNDLAPRAIWDDDGLMVIQLVGRVAIFFGGRSDGWWIAHSSELELMEARAVRALAAAAQASPAD